MRPGAPGRAVGAMADNNPHDEARNMEPAPGMQQRRRNPVKSSDAVGYPGTVRRRGPMTGGGGEGLRETTVSTDMVTPRGGASGSKSAPYTSF